jgi:hypothetical protein
VHRPTCGQGIGDWAPKSGFLVRMTWRLFAIGMMVKRYREIRKTQAFQYFARIFEAPITPANRCVSIARILRLKRSRITLRRFQIGFVLGGPSVWGICSLAPQPLVQL